MVHLKYYYAILFMAMGGLSTVLAVKELKWEVSGYSRASASDVLVNQAKQVAKIVVFHSYKRHRKSPKQNFILELPQTVRKRHTQVAFYAFDCSEKTGVCEDQGIEKYPTLSLYFQGNKHLYRGQFSSAECLSWIGDLLLITAHPVDSLAHFLQEKNGLKDTDNFFVFFCGNPSSPAFSLLNSVSKTRQGDKFYYSKDQVLVEYLGCKENEFLLVRSKETTKYAGKANQALGLEVFILQHKFRNVSIPSLAKHKDFLSDKRPALIFFNDKLDEELLAILDKVGSTVGERVALNYFHETASNKRMVKKINNLVGVTQEHKPCIRLVQFANGLPLRYKMVPEEFKPDKIVMFVERVLLGKEEPYLRSQAVKEHHKYFSRLVGLNIREFTSNQDFDSCVFYFNSYVRCPSCKEAFFTFKKAAKKYSRKTLKFATFNKSKNDLDVLITSKVPFMECYSRDKGRFLFEGEFAWPSVAHFMESLTSEVASGDDKGEQDASKDDTDL